MLASLSGVSTGVKTTVGILLAVAAVSFGYFAVDSFVTYARSDIQQRLTEVTNSYAEYRRKTEEASRLADSAAVEANTAYRQRERYLIDEAIRISVEYEAARGSWSADATKSAQRLRVAESKLDRALSQLAAPTDRSTSGDPRSPQVPNASGDFVGPPTASGLVHGVDPGSVGEIYKRHFGPVAAKGERIVSQLAICYRVVEEGSQPVRRAPTPVQK